MHSQIFISIFFLQKLAKDETKCLAEQKEKIRLELQDIYQKQVDKVVKVKLQEFQTQLDAAESEFLDELKTRQQVIAECAAKKIKDIMDKYVYIHFKYTSFANNSRTQIVQ